MDIEGRQAEPDQFAGTNDSELITPEQTIRHWFGEEPPFGLRHAVVTWGQRAFSAIEKALGSQRVEWPHQLNPLSLDDDGVGVLLAPVGAPGTVAMMEELRALGARSFIGFGSAGGLDPKLGPGHIVVATQCVPEEGTSTNHRRPLIT